MSAIKVNFEISHEATRRSKKTPEGFTHDWEVIVRGQEGADISHFVDKVVFSLHSSFPKPRRVVKEPPFSIKESGYAGFVFPIEIHVKNKNEPKKITFVYNLTFQHSGSLKDRYIFQNPNEEFRRKLLKGGGIIVNNDTFYTNPDQESRSRDSFSNEKQQLVSKPKLSSENVKKHKAKEKTKEDIPHKTTSFENLFGAPIQKPPKVSPDPKRIEKNLIKTEKKDKERSSSDKKSKHEHKDIKQEKMKIKEERDKQKSDKVKNIGKDCEKTKEKSNKRPGDRPVSPDVVKKKCLSPNRKIPSPLPLSSASNIKDDYKSSKNNIETFDPKKIKTEERLVEVKVEKEKKKKEKKSHDRDKERKDKKEHKKESHKSKESPKDTAKGIPVSKDIMKERESIKDLQSKEKQPKPEKAINKFSIENLKKTPQSNIDEVRIESHKAKDKNDSERKHKHKKKDKKRDESREKHKETSKEKRHKHDKVREIHSEKPEHVELRETPVPKENLIAEPPSPISIDSASQSSESKSGLAKLLNKTEDNISSHSESEDSIIAEDDDVKIKLETHHSPEPVKHEPSPEPELEPEPEPEPEPEIEPVIEPIPMQVQQKEKSKKHKDKSKREEKRRKRKAAEEEDAESRKVAKAADPGPTNNDNEHGESSGSISIETKVQDNGVSSSLGEDGESGDLSPDYMVQLRGLQQRIMTIKNNEDLERVVNLIAETGRYEVTTQTFDFDLCLLDRSTVQQLIQLVGC